MCRGTSAWAISIVFAYFVELSTSSIVALCNKKIVALVCVSEEADNPPISVNEKEKSSVSLSDQKICRELDIASISMLNFSWKNKIFVAEESLISPCLLFFFNFVFVCNFIVKYHAVDWGIGVFGLLWKMNKDAYEKRNLIRVFV